MVGFVDCVVVVVVVVVAVACWLVGVCVCWVWCVCCVLHVVVCVALMSAVVGGHRVLVVLHWLVWRAGCALVAAL